MVDRDELKNILHPLLKLCISGFGLLVFRFLIGLLPGFERELTSLDIQVGTFVIAGVTILIAGVIVYYSRSLYAAIRDSSSLGVQQKRSVARVIQLMSLLVGLLILHSGLDSLVSQAAGEGSPIPYVFDIGFLATGILVLVHGGWLAFKSIEKITESVVDFIVSVLNVTESTGGTDDPNQTPTGSSTDTIACSNCGSTFDQDATYCGECGNELSS